MSSGKSKRQKIGLKRAERKSTLQEAKLRHKLRAGLKRGTIIAVDRSKVFSRSAGPRIPKYYRDKLFTCKDCGKEEVWTARQQQQWYEEQGGEIEAIAIRCHACRRKEKLRRETARKVHLEGIAKKRKASA